MRTCITLLVLVYLRAVYSYEIIVDSFSITTYNTYQGDLSGNPDVNSMCTSLGINTTTQWDLAFEVKSCNDAFILLTETADLTGPAIFEITLGGYLNTRICENTVTSQITHLIAESILHCDKYMFFWLKWTINGDVSFGNGSTIDVNTIFTRSTGKIIGGLGVRSGFGETAHWRQTVCSTGTYAATCDLSCGHCLNTVCQRDDGTCPDGCVPGWTGVLCFDANDCAVSPCLNGGTCYDNSGKAVCSCTNQYTGLFCEILCAPSPVKERIDTTSGLFSKEIGLKLSDLNQLNESIQCSLPKCAFSCLLHSECWYFRFDKTVTGCQPCLLYNSSVPTCVESGPFDEHLYKLDQD